jgi:hypothetical protein
MSAAAPPPREARSNLAIAALALGILSAIYVTADKFPTAASPAWICNPSWSHLVEGRREY